MKEIKLQNKTYLFVEVPNDTENVRCHTYFNQATYLIKFESFEIKLPKGKWIRISTTKDITELEAESIVDKFEQKIGWRLDGDISKLNSIVLFQNYNYEKPVPVTFLLGTAKESLNSLTQSLGLDVEKNYLILQKL